MCASGEYKTGTQCDGTTMSDTHTCASCNKGGTNYMCASGEYKSGTPCGGTTTDTQTCAACSTVTLPHGTCTECTTASANDCTAVTCDIDHYNTDQFVPNGCEAVPTMNTVSCGDSTTSNPSSPSIQAQSCPTSESLVLTINGTNLQRTTQVKVDDANCDIQSIIPTETQVICNVATSEIWKRTTHSDNTNGYIVKALTSNGTSTYSSSQPTPGKIFFADPEVTSITGDKSTDGGEITVTGLHFGPIISAISVSVLDAYFSPSAHSF